MITFTEKASSKVLELMQANETGPVALKIAILGRGPGGFIYSLRFVPEGERGSEDMEQAFEGFNVYVDAESAADLEGAKVDFLEDRFRSGFTVDNPNPVWKDPTAQSIQEILDTRVNPGVASHGGFVTLMEYRDNTAYIAFGGGCQGCGLVDVTMKQGVEVMIKEAVPEVKAVVDLTDHGSGERPYFDAAEGEQSPFTG
jgi:Fe/S biogenesis protein NfuA